MLALALASGCATPQGSDELFGYFIPAPVPEHDNYLAGEVARQLASLLPPASTRIELRQPCRDAFGQSLINQLRNKGYAVREASVAEARSDKDTARQGEGPPPLGATPLNYVVDAIESPALYRVTLRFGDQSLSRAYQPRGTALQPVGAWMRRERPL